MVVHTIFTILVGLVTMILFVLAVGLFGWIASEFNKDPMPNWLQGVCVLITVILIIDVAYWVGKWILGVLC